MGSLFLVTTNLFYTIKSATPRFPKGKDCILSLIWLIKPSFKTNTRSVSECLPYPTITDLGSNTADCPILHIFTFGYDY